MTPCQCQKSSGINKDLVENQKHGICMYMTQVAPFYDVFFSTAPVRNIVLI